jgi:hypothetical protein
MVKDPVCGMEVDEKTAIKVDYDGKNTISVMRAVKQSLKRTLVNM